MQNTQQPKLTANEIMQRVQAMLDPMILQHPIQRDHVQDGVLTAFIKLKRDVWGSDDGHQG